MLTPCIGKHPYSGVRRHFLVVVMVMQVEDTGDSRLRRRLMINVRCWASYDLFHFSMGISNLFWYMGRKFWGFKKLWVKSFLEKENWKVMNNHGITMRCWKCGKPKHLRKTNWSMLSMVEYCSIIELWLYC